ncbi:MAG: hypothetical protein HKN58_11065 [Xanthomonadales bacterium]|nr:hypothetical protein [Xanthomonadales bacterium]
MSLAFTPIAAALLSLVLVSAVAAETPTAEALERLAKGEILAENVLTSESGGAVRARVLMQVELATVWNYIASCDHVFEYVDGMQYCELLEVRRDGAVDVSTVRQVVDRGWLVPEMDFTIRVRREPHERIDFELVEGNLDALRGYWRFESLPGVSGLLVTHEIQVRPSFPVPRWLVRRTIRKGIPDMLACLRGLTSAPSQSSSRSDLRRCPDNPRASARAPD